MPLQLKLYHYWRSSASWRVRFAFAAKGIQVDLIPLNLLLGESETPEHLKRNPLGHVPVLEVTDQSGPDAGKPRYLAESLAIIEWAEEIYPTNPLLPADSWLRARVRQLAEIINAGTQPLTNLGVASFHPSYPGSGQPSQSSAPAQEKAWNQHWMHRGLEAYEMIVRETAGKFSVGDTLTMADICLVPQCYSAGRFDVSLQSFPTLARINEQVLKLESCQAAHPDRFAPQSPR